MNPEGQSNPTGKTKDQANNQGSQPPIAESLTPDVAERLTDTAIPWLIGLIFLIWTVRATWLYQIDMAVPAGPLRECLSLSWKVLVFGIPPLIFPPRQAGSVRLAGLGLSTVPTRQAVIFATVSTGLYLAGMLIIATSLEGKTFEPLRGRFPLPWLTALASATPSAFLEELLFRGWMLPWLARWRGPRMANPLTALLFMGIHLPHWLWIGEPGNALVAHALAVTLLGLFLGWLRLRTESLWPSILAHALNNTLVGFLV
jgi:membrane protease YdiL (CAAX protease family)